MKTYAPDTTRRMARWFAPQLPLVALLLTSCSSADRVSSPSQGQNESSAPDVLTTWRERLGFPVPAVEGPWRYQGPLRDLTGANALQNVHVYTSIAGHTVRVVGCLPTTYSKNSSLLQQLQRNAYYARITEGALERETESDGQKVKWVKLCQDRFALTVVYPIATGKLDAGKDEGRGGVRKLVRIYPYSPSDSTASWGGLPFIGYSGDGLRGLGFHGPISQQENSWVLWRKRMSHNCFRMSAHVVEMAHLLGVDMTKQIANSEAYEEKKIHLEVMGDDLKFGIENNPDGRMFDFLAKRGIDGKVVFKQDSTETPQLTIVDVNYPKLYESADVPRDEIYLRHRDNPEKITFRDEDGDRYVHVFPTWLNRETCWATPHAAGTKKGLLSSQCGEMTPPQLGEFADQQRALSLPPKDIRYVLIDANVPASALESY